MGSVNTRVGLGWVELGWVEIFYFRWVGLGPKLKIFTFGEFIDTDGHGYDYVVGYAGS